MYRTGPRTKLRLARLLLALLSVAFLVLLARVTFFAAASPKDQAASAALDYARATMVWSVDPRVAGTYITPMSGLQNALRRYVPLPLASHVNVADLLKHHSSGESVALVVLKGTYNSLPPDEGVVVNGPVVALVRMRDDRVLLLTD